MTSRRSHLVAGPLVILLAIGFTDGSAAGARAVEPSINLPTTQEYAVESSARVALNPVAKTAAVSFGTSYSGRTVELQSQAGSATDWTQVAQARTLDKTGATTFSGLDPDAEVGYRAVVAATGIKAAKTTTTVSLDEQWQTTLHDDFNADGLNARWSDRAVGEQVTSRLCSLPSDDADVRSVTDGNFAAGIVKHTDDSYAQKVIASANPAALTAYKKAIAAAYKGKASKRKAAIATADLRLSTTYGCPQGVFENTSISTYDNPDRFKINTARPGMISARIKFPTAQGMHGALWLQSLIRGGGEIDVIESFGYGAGLINYIHAPSTGKMYKPGIPGKSKRYGGSVLIQTAKNRAWWNAYHEYSVEWTTTKFIFRVDGQVTTTMKLKPGNASYSVILSLLSSDWELPRMLKPVGRGEAVTDLSDQKMLVDWVTSWTKA